MANYPTSLDSFPTTHVDNVSEVIHASLINELADGANKIEAELGVLPKGTFASVRARLDAIQHIPTATVAVAASNASSNFATSADYICDGTADQAEINAAIASLPSSGGSVLLSEGTFTISAPVICQKDKIAIKGQGRMTTIILRGASYTDSGSPAGMVQINRDDIASGVNRRPAEGCEISDLTIDGAYLGTQNSTSGLVFKCYRGVIDNIVAQHCSARGIVVRGATSAERGGSGDWNTYETVIGRILVHHNGQGGVLFDSAATDCGLDGNGSHIFQNCGPGVHVNATIQCVAGCFIWGNFTQSVAGGSLIGAGIYITDGGGHFRVVNCKIEQNRNGILITNGWGHVITGNYFSSNSTTINGSTDGESMPSGWYVTGAANQTDDISYTGGGMVIIAGNTFNPGAWAVDKSRYCVNLAFNDRIRVEANVFDNTAATSTIGWNTSGGDVVVKNNTGYVTEASGQATITSAATTVVVTHGLAITPKAENISLALLTNTTNDIGTLNVESVGATTFTIRCRAVPGASTAVIGWAVTPAAKN